MLERALIVVLVALAVVVGAAHVGQRLQATFCEVSAALSGGQCRMNVVTYQGHRQP